MLEQEGVEAGEAQLDVAKELAVTSKNYKPSLVRFYPDGSYNALATGVGFTSYAEGPNEEKALHYLAMWGDIDALELVFREYRDVNNPDIYGNSPLHLASNFRVARHLLINGANPDLNNTNWQTPLMIFLNNAVVSAARGVMPEYNEYFHMAVDAFQAANLDNYSDSQKHFIFSYISNPLFSSLATHPKVEYLQGWVEANRQMQEGEDEEIFRLQVELGRRKMQTFAQKVRSSDTQFKDFLTQEGGKQKSLADLIKSKIFPGSIFIYYPNDEVNYLATGIAWNKQLFLQDASNGQYSAHYLAYHGEVDALEDILLDKEEYEVDEYVNHQDFEGNSPLHFAAWAGQFETVESLLSYGAYPYEVNMYQETPLHIALYEAINLRENGEDVRNYLASISVLLNECEMQIFDYLDSEGKSAMDLIMEHEFLRDHFKDHELVLDYQRMEERAAEMEKKAALLEADAGAGVMSGAGEEVVTAGGKATASAGEGASANMSAAQLRRHKEKIKKEAERARRAELGELGLADYADDIIRVGNMMRGGQLREAGDRLVAALQKANILEMRKIFNSFGEDKNLLVRALASSQNHDPRILLAVINDPTIDLGGAMEGAISSVTTFVDGKPSFRSPENRAKLLNSMACIKILGDKIEASEEEKALLSDLFTKLGIKNSSANSAKFLSKVDQNFLGIFRDYFNARDFPLSRIPLISMALFSVEDAASRTGYKGDEIISLAITAVTGTDLETKATQDPTTPYAIELVKARMGCVVPTIKFSNARATVPMICYAAEADNILLQYLIAEGCPLDIKVARTPLECAKRAGNAENVRLITAHLAAMSKTEGSDPATSMIPAGLGGMVEYLGRM